MRSEPSRGLLQQGCDPSLSPYFFVRLASRPPLTLETPTLSTDALLFPAERNLVAAALCLFRLVCSDPRGRPRTNVHSSRCALTSEPLPPFACVCVCECARDERAQPHRRHINHPVPFPPLSFLFPVHCELRPDGCLVTVAWIATEKGLQPIDRPETPGGAPQPPYLPQTPPPADCDRLCLIVYLSL